MIYYQKYGKNREGTILFSSEKYFSNKVKSRGESRQRLIKLFEFLILSLIIIALARPRKIDRLSESKIDVVDILLVLDISSSMLADDFTPNRLEVVKNTAKEFVSSRNGDRLGVVVFAGQSFIQCPLTVDINVLNNLINEINVADREYDGTAIGMAIANATNRLRDSEAKSKIMILLSDGSNNTGEIDPATAAAAARTSKTTTMPTSNNSPNDNNNNIISNSSNSTNNSATATTTRQAQQQKQQQQQQQQQRQQQHHHQQ